MRAGAKEPRGVRSDDREGKPGSGPESTPTVKITEKEVRYIAGLSNLELSDQEIAKYRADLEEILTYVDKLNELDTCDLNRTVWVSSIGTLQRAADTGVPPCCPER